jgi:hypothetical protein
VTQPVPDIEADYLHVHRNLDVARTVAVTPTINVDLDAFGRVYGVERIGGPVDTETLTAVLRELPQVAGRCRSCDHLIGEHSEGGCWYTVTTGRVNANLVCACSVERR